MSVEPNVEQVWALANQSDGGNSELFLNSSVKKLATAILNARAVLEEHGIPADQAVASVESWVQAGLARELTNPRNRSPVSFKHLPGRWTI